MQLLQISLDTAWVEITPILGIKLAIDLLSVLVLVRGVYLKKHHRTDLFLTFFSFNVIVFFISYLLNRVEMSTGAAFGLFAIFSILRYRTEGISARDMTYLFLCIAIGLITAVSRGNITEHFIISAFIILLTFLLESGFVLKNRACMKIVFDRTDLLHPSKRTELILVLENKIGFKISHIEVGDIDFLKDSVMLDIYYVHA